MVARHTASVHYSVSFQLRYYKGVSKPLAVTVGYTVPYHRLF